MEWFTPKPMSEFKFACPVCGQHISCDVSQTGSEMTCPTCFQKIIAPQSPSSSDTKLVLTGIRASDRQTSKIPRVMNPGTPATPAKDFPGALVVGIILIFICTVVAVIYHGTIFKTPAADSPTNQISSPTNSPPPTNNDQEKISNNPAK